MWALKRVTKSQLQGLGKSLKEVSIHSQQILVKAHSLGRGSGDSTEAEVLRARVAVAWESFKEAVGKCTGSTLLLPLNVSLNGHLASVTGPWIHIILNRSNHTRALYRLLLTNEPHTQGQVRSGARVGEQFF